MISMSVSRSIQRNMESIAGSFMMTVRMSTRVFNHSFWMTNSYDKYASDAGIKNAAAGAILVNKGTFDVYNENSSKYVKKRDGAVQI